jgi:DNA modification methylase
LLGLEDLPVIRIPGLTAPQKSALAIADNKMAELGEYDLDILGEELALLYDAEINLDFDPSITGFDTVELDQLILDRGPDAADAVEPPATSKPAVTQLGDVWHCGAHKLICGNALLTATYDALMGDEQAQIVFTDPPYNVSNSGHVSKRDGVREFAMAHSEMSSDEFTTFLSTACTMMRRYSADGAVVFICMDWRHLPELWAAAGPVLGPPKNTIVWVKTNAGMGSFYRSQHELVLPYVVGSRSPINNFGLGAKGRYRTNVWQYPGLNSFGRDRDVALASHPTVKPVALVADALKDCSHRGGVVLDPFAGSGTTMVAAERTGRSARLIEIDPYYCDVAVRRWEAFSKKSATLAATGQSFTDAAKSRSSREA